MKVLMVVDGLHPGGKERRLVELMRSLKARRDAEVELVVMSEEIRYPDVLTLGIPILPMIRRTPHDPGVFRRFYRLCRERAPDLIHTWDPMTSLYAAPVARLLGIPLVNGMVTKAPARLSWRSLERIAAFLTFPLSAAVVGNSRAGLQSFRVPPEKGRCIHNGFNLDRLTGLDEPAETRKRLGITTPRVVAMVAAFTPKKDYPTFIRAARELLARRDDITFLAVGDGPTRAAAEAMREPDQAGKILFPGWVSGVESLMRAVDIGVLATDADVHGEGIPNALLEFMALGKPVVATRTGGTGELVAEGATGFLVGNRDSGAMAARIQQILDDPALSHALGECGRTRVHSEFTIEAMTGSYVELYRQLLPSGRKADVHAARP
jgi:glycosyltransferase involved in cell wall biosynthesis